MSYGLSGVNWSAKPPAALKSSADASTAAQSAGQANNNGAVAMDAASNTANPANGLPAAPDSGNLLGQILPLISQLLTAILPLISGSLGAGGGNAFQGTLGGSNGATPLPSPAGSSDGSQAAQQTQGAQNGADTTAGTPASEGNPQAANPMPATASGGSGNNPTYDRTIDPSIVPPGGLNASNVDEYAEKLSKKFGFSKDLILAQAKKESGPDFTDLGHKGDTDRTPEQGGISVGPNQITEGVLRGGIWSNGADGIDLSPQEAEQNPALAWQAGLIHLSDYVKQSGGDIEQALRKYVGHDEDSYIADIRKYGGDI